MSVLDQIMDLPGFCDAILGLIQKKERHPSLVAHLSNHTVCIMFIGYTEDGEPIFSICIGLKEDSAFNSDTLKQIPPSESAYDGENQDYYSFTGVVPKFLPLVQFGKCPAAEGYWTSALDIKIPITVLNTDFYVQITHIYMCKQIDGKLYDNYRTMCKSIAMWLEYLN
jgi:hypothetical protein